MNEDKKNWLLWMIGVFTLILFFNAFDVSDKLNKIQSTVNNIPLDCPAQSVQPTPDWSTMPTPDFSNLRINCDVPYTGATSFQCTFR